MENSKCLTTRKLVPFQSVQITLISKCNLMNKALKSLLLLLYSGNVIKISKMSHYFNLKHMYFCIP